MKKPGLEFLGRLAGGLVHEIKNPLSTVAINLTLLKEDLVEALPGDRALHRRVDVLETEVRRLDAILNDFMRFAGMRRLEKKPVDLGGLVAEMVEFAAPGFSRDGVVLEADVADGLVVAADAGLFKRALFNILLNGQQAIAASGSVRIRGRREDGRAVLEIVDDGRGIPAGELEQVFDVYYSGSNAGSGLGLPMARRILEEHGGSLDLLSTVGEGTTVRLEVPLA